MGYMGFGMRKEVYDRKPRDPYAHRKSLLKDTEQTLKDAKPTEHPIPTEPLIKPLTKGDKMRIAFKVFGAIIAVIIVALMLLAAVGRLMYR